MNFQLPPPGIPVFTPQGFMVRRGSVPFHIPPPLMGIPTFLPPPPPCLMPLPEVPAPSSSQNDAASERRNLLKEQLMKQITGEADEKEELMDPIQSQEVPSPPRLAITPPKAVPYTREELIQIKQLMQKNRTISELPDSADGVWILEDNIYAPHGSELRLAEGLVRDRPKRGKNAVWVERAERHSSDTSPEESVQWSNADDRMDQDEATTSNHQYQSNIWEEQKDYAHDQRNYQNQEDSSRDYYQHDNRQQTNAQNYRDDDRYNNYQDYKENQCNREVASYNTQKQGDYQQNGSNYKNYDRNLSESSSSQRYQREAEDYNRANNNRTDSRQKQHEYQNYDRQMSESSSSQRYQQEAENYDQATDRTESRQTQSEVIQNYDRQMSESQSSQRHQRAAENFSRASNRTDPTQNQLQDPFEASRRRFEANRHGIGRKEKQPSEQQITNKYNLPRSNFGIWNYFCRGKPLSEEARKGTALEGLNDWELQELFKKMSLEAVGAVYTPPQRLNHQEQDQRNDTRSQRSSNSRQSYHDERATEYRSNNNRGF